MNDEMNRRWTLTGKTALVTGATKGIGRAIAAELLGLGARVLITARQAAEVETLVAEWRTNGFDASGVTTDAATNEGRATTLQAVAETFGGLDILINNVGTNIRKATIDYTPDEYQKLWQTNAESAFELSRLSYPLLKKSDAASIVNIVSVAGLTNVGTGVIYAMTKAALIEMTKYLAVEWGADGIRVNAVAPWFTITPLTENLLAQEQLMNAVKSRTPLGRVADAEEVAGITAFLCLPAASYITGQCVATDGGFLSKGM